MSQSSADTFGAESESELEDSSMQKDEDGSEKWYSNENDSQASHASKISPVKNVQFLLDKISERSDDIIDEFEHS